MQKNDNEINAVNILTNLQKIVAGLDVNDQNSITTSAQKVIDLERSLRICIENSGTLSRELQLALDQVSSISEQLRLAL